MPLQIDRNDRVALDQRRIRVHAGVSEGGRDANQRIASSLNFVMHLQTVDGGVSAASVVVLLRECIN